MSTPTNPYGYPNNPEQPGDPRYPPSQPPYPDQAFGAPQPGQPQHPGAAPYPPYPPYPYPPAPYPQAPYPPQGYPMYPQGGMPPYGPPPERQSHTTLWVILGILGALATVACVACAFLFVGLGQFVQKAAQPAIVTVDFCQDLRTQNYTAAYGLLTSGLQQQVTEDAFVKANQAHDASDGTVTQCSVSSGSSHVQFGDGSVTLPLTVARGAGAPVTGNITLTQSGTTWRISAIDPGLGLLS
jgi:hypothetical protein